jgi:hypothetical protein
MVVPYRQAKQLAQALMNAVAAVAVEEHHDKLEEAETALVVAIQEICGFIK